MSSEAKVYLLSTNEEWRERYDDLVKSGLIADFVFWSDKQEAIRAAIACLGTTENLKMSLGQLSPQQRAAATLRKIRGVTDGKGEVKFRLTSDIIASIYSNIPRVKELHVEHVDSGKLSEKDFWTQFCTSKTFGKELGVGEDFVGKEGNIFDAAFSAVPAAIDEDTGSENVNAQQSASSTPPGLLNDDDDVAEYFEHQGDFVRNPSLIKKINHHSLREAMSIDFDYSRQSPAKTPHQQSPVSVVSTASKDDIQVHDGQSRVNIQSIDGAWFTDRLMTFDGFKSALHIDQSPKYVKILPDDFTEDHFGVTVRHYRNCMHLLRIFWRLQPMSSFERHSLCSLTLEGIDKLWKALPEETWPSQEKEKASLLLMACRNCIERARERYESQPSKKKL